MIHSLSFIHDHDRMSSITWVLHNSTWDYFSSSLPEGFSRSPTVVQEAIITDIDDLVGEFRRTSSDVGASFFAMRCLLDILQEIPGSFLRLAEKNLQRLSDDRISAKIKILLDRYQKMFDQSICKSKDVGDMLRFLPGVVVQKRMNPRGMADLYRIKPDLLEHLIKSIIEPLRGISGEENHSYDELGDYLSGFFRDRDRSQLYYRDPILQHIYICRHILSLLNGSNTIGLQS